LEENSSRDNIELLYLLGVLFKDNLPVLDIQPVLNVVVDAFAKVLFVKVAFYELLHRYPEIGCWLLDVEVVDFSADTKTINFLEFTNIW